MGYWRCILFNRFCCWKGEPKANYDFNIPGERGGTLRTRYEGKLEGVSPCTKEMVLSNARKEGLRVHEWLEKVINNYVKMILKHLIVN